jgi:hypothetical protein
MDKFKTKGFEELRTSMSALVERPDRVTEILLGMPRDKYEALKRHLFREAFPDEGSVIQFINNLYVKEKNNNNPQFEHQIVNFLLSEQHKIALFNSEFWADGNISLGEVKTRILELIKKDAIEQGELFPVFSPQRSVELKKDFALNFGGLDRIEKEHKHLLNEKLSSGFTLQQHIDKVRDWFNNLRGEDLGNWIKLFAYIKAVKDFSGIGGEYINFREMSPGRYCFSIKQDKKFFEYFIRPDKNSGQFTTKTKTRFLKWLHDNQNTIEFPLIFNGKVWNVPMRIYEYAESVSDKQMIFTVDTNILESQFKDYVSINIDEINAIEELWETMAENNTDFAKHRLVNFVDVPLKFLLVLKNIYNREGNFSNGEFTGNIQRLSAESLDSRLGNLSERIKKHLVKNGKIRTGKSGKLLGMVENLVYLTTFQIAKERGWIHSLPAYENKTYRFNMNAGYFDRKHTAERLKAVKPA